MIEKPSLVEGEIRELALVANVERQEDPRHRPVRIPRLKLMSTSGGLVLDDDADRKLSVNTGVLSTTVVSVVSVKLSS
jgi:hypothetical protein